MSESYTIYIPEDLIVFGVIAMIVVVALMVRRRRKSRRSTSFARPAAHRVARVPGASNRRDQLTTKIRGLEQRLAAFEHYATDPARRLATEIDELGSAEGASGKPVA